MVVSGLLISWATPEASSPTAESFSAWTSWACVRLQLLELAQRLRVEPRVVERDADLVGGRLDQRDLPLGERVAVLAAERQRAENAGPGCGWRRRGSRACDRAAPPTWRPAAGSATRRVLDVEGLAGGGHAADEPGAHGQRAVDLAQPRRRVRGRPRRCRVAPSSESRCRLEISWPVTWVRASSAVRSTSSTSSERLTVSATVCRISR